MPPPPCPSLDLDVAWGERKGLSGKWWGLGQFPHCGRSQIPYLLNPLTDMSLRRWWGPNGTVAIPYSVQCLAYCRCSGTPLPLPSSWSRLSPG